MCRANKSIKIKKVPTVFSQNLIKNEEFLSRLEHLLTIVRNNFVFLCILLPTIKLILITCDLMSTR